MPRHASQVGEQNSSQNSVTNLINQEISPGELQQNVQVTDFKYTDRHRHIYKHAKNV